MRSTFLSGLTLAALLLATPAQAATKSAARTSETAPKSAALTSKTAFKVDPYRAMRCSFLRTLAGTQIATENELDLLNDGNDGQIDNWSLAKATLVICGVEDPEQQKHYFAQLNKIEAECKKATAGIRSPKARAEALGKFLLKGPMHGGYVSGQSDFIKLLNTGTFNCVSSATLYNLMAPRVGIQVRTVTICGHVFSRALDFDIEPTSGDVYNLDDRASRSLKNRTVVNSSIAPYQEQIFRETGNVGLLSSMYNNNANEFLGKKQYAMSVATYLKAACLDPGDPGTVYNLRVTLATWINDCKAHNKPKLAASIQNFENAVLRPYEETVLKVATK